MAGTKVNRRLLLDAQHEFTIVEESVPQPKAGEVVVKIAANGICGSDVHFYHRGWIGNFKVTVPYTPGHECSGVIESVGEGAGNFKPGDRVVIEPGIPCRKCVLCKTGRYNLCPDVVFLSAPPINGTFCDYVAVDAGFVYPIPDELSLELAALVEPAAVAVHAVNRARFHRGADGVILGAGTIGLMTLQAFKAMGGGRAVCVDMLDKRLDLAKQLGADEVINPAKGGKVPANSADVVFETAGSSKTTAQLYEIARPAGCAVQVGWPDTADVPMDVATLMEKEIDYVGVSRYANAFPAALTYLADGRIRGEAMVTDRFGFMDSAEAFRHAHENAKDTIKVVVLND